MLGFWNMRFGLCLWIVHFATHSSSAQNVGVQKPVLGAPKKSIEVKVNDLLLIMCWAKHADEINLEKQGYSGTLSSLGFTTEKLPRDEFNNQTIFGEVIRAASRHDGTYICTGTKRGLRTERIEIKVQVLGSSPSSGNPDLKSGAFIGGMSITIAVVTLLVIWILYEFFGRKRNGLTKEEIEEFLLGNRAAIRAGGFANENAAYMPYNNTYEIPKHKLYVDRDQVLGSGAFGQVFKGTLNSKTVAVKTVKPGADKMSLKSLLTELKIMTHLGSASHPNIVTLLGAATKDLNTGNVYMIVDFCPMGNMEHYLRENAKHYVNDLDEKSVPSFNARGPLSTRDLNKWSYQIASGMEYLGQKKVIHGDLATRNVLLYDRDTVKITDFGLSRQLYDYKANYIKQNMEPLPWRWMAFESLRELTFSCLSDIWSYGVTIWEMFTLGEVPYPGLSWTNEFVDSLRDKHRLAMPKCATYTTYNEMLKCWNIDPDQRPSFSDLKHYFKALVGPTDDQYQDLHDTSIDMPQ